MTRLTVDSVYGIWAGVTLSWDEQYRFDEETYAQNVERTIAAGVHGVYTTGSTGEFCVLEFEEFCRMVDIQAELCGRGYPCGSMTALMIGGPPSIMAARVSSASSDPKVWVTSVSASTSPSRSKWLATGKLMAGSAKVGRSVIFRKTISLTARSMTTPILGLLRAILWNRP